MQTFVWPGPWHHIVIQFHWCAELEASWQTPSQQITKAFTNTMRPGYAGPQLTLSLTYPPTSAGTRISM